MLYFSHVKEVEKDIRRIVPSSALGEEHVAKTFRKYNLENFTVAKTPEGTSMLVCAAGEVDESHYTDPRSKKTYGFDHKAQTWTGEASDEFPTDESVEELRAAMQVAMDEYLSSFFNDENKALSAAAVYGKGGNLEIRVSGVASDLRNYWSGGWRSSYTVSISGGNSASVSGSVKLIAHYFEDGNVQMNTSNEFQGTAISFTDGANLAGAVKEQISTFESDLHNELGSVYTRMSADTFKDMRRILPITKQKFDWSGVQSKLNSNLQSS